jgi:hypothetical protein
VSKLRFFILRFSAGSSRVERSWKNRSRSASVANPREIRRGRRRLPEARHGRGTFWRSPRACVRSQKSPGRCSAEKQCVPRRPKTSHAPASPAFSCGQPPLMTIVIFPSKTAQVEVTRQACSRAMELSHVTRATDLPQAMTSASGPVPSAPNVFPSTPMKRIMETKRFASGCSLEGRMACPILVTLLPPPISRTGRLS